MAATCLKSMALPTCGQIKLNRQPARGQVRNFAVRTSRAVCVRPAAKITAEQTEKMGSEVGKFLALSTVASSWLAAGDAQAASELAQLAAGDNRFGIIATLFVPVVGWALFNIGGPLSRQLEKMNSEAPAEPKKGTAKLRKGGLAAAVGLGAAASMLLADNADAATELAQLAAGDNRFGIIATLFVPVVGWALFNIGGPLSRQLDKMNAEAPAEPKKGTAKLRKGGLAAAVGLSAAASMLLADNADAATELAQLAAGDNRFGIIATLFVPVVGWALFNIGGPLSRQLDKMNAEAPAEPKKGTAKLRKGGLAAAVGLSAAASMLLADNADAATELAQLAAGDNRFGIIATLFVPVVGWALFNIGGPLSRQLDKMNSEAPSAPTKGTAKLRKGAVAASAGLGAAASMFLAENADAATEMAQLAASDNRFGIIATLFLPVVGWALFNIGGPLSRQLEKMNSEAPSAPKKSGTARLKK